ncbi:uncharacterized protein LOC143291549 [Babylonia areolata]|uniref:uncharacterized protein LOC143291549 n=1 Tax=Babylonia areolata TaxID=304850 RepID=UPI003FD3DD9A
MLNVWLTVRNRLLSSGVLQSHRWHPAAGTKAAAKANAWSRAWRLVVIPPGHVMLLSFLYNAMAHTDRLLMELTVWNERQVVADITGGEIEDPVLVLEPGVLRVVKPKRAKTVEYTESPGYRLLFTLFQISRRPMQLPSGRWNCSDVTWPGEQGLEPHLGCNLLVQCEDGRDEDGCGYPRCHQDGFEVGGKCYILDWRKDASHHQVHRLCQSKGAQLASFSPHDNVTDLLRVLWKRHPFDVKIGLTSPISLLPWMYRKSLTWMDTTVAHAVDTRLFDKSDLVKPKCGGLGKYHSKKFILSVGWRSSDHWTSTFILWNCQTQAVKHIFFLCKVDGDTAASRAAAVRSVSLDWNTTTPALAAAGARRVFSSELTDTTGTSPPLPPAPFRA